MTCSTWKNILRQKNGIQNKYAEWELISVVSDTVCLYKDYFFPSKVGTKINERGGFLLLPKCN